MPSDTVAKVLLIDPRNRGLLLRVASHRTDPSKSFTPDLPGGLVEDGESPEQGVIRETLEETGLRLSPRDLVLAREGYDDTSYRTILFVAFLDRTPGIELSWEHDQYGWYEFGDLLDRFVQIPRSRESFRVGLQDLLGSPPAGSPTLEAIRGSWIHRADKP